MSRSIVRLDYSYGPPRLYTLHLFRGDDLDTGHNADVRAKVTYGVGAIQNSFYTDWLHGAQISLLASYASVDAESWRPDETAAYSAPAGAITLGAALGEGTPTGAIPATLTESLFSIAPQGATRDFVVPDFARRVSVRVIDASKGLTPGTASNVLLFCLVSGGNNMTIVDCAEFYGSLAEDGVQLPGGTQFIRITNNNGNPFTGARRISITWYLSL